MLKPVLPDRVLLGGRLLLAVSLSARVDGNTEEEDEARAAVQAASVLLRHIAAVLPIALGAAETFDETCRGEWRWFKSHTVNTSVCRVPVPQQAASRGPKYAWYRPINFRAAEHEGSTTSQGHAEDRAGAPDSIPLSLITESGGLDFSWLLPDGGVSQYLNFDE
jgi:hypothetical protein